MRGHLIRRLIKSLIRRCGYEIRPLARISETADIPDRDLYQPYENPYPVFQPWLGDGEFEHYYHLAKPYTLVEAPNCFTLYQLVRQALAVDGEIWECGVYHGGTAAMLAALVANYDDRHGTHHQVRLFDTFAGLPDPDSRLDRHCRGEFAETSVEAVRERVGHADRVSFRPGLIPETFRGLEGARGSPSPTSMWTSTAPSGTAALPLPAARSRGLPHHRRLRPPQLPGCSPGGR